MMFSLWLVAAFFALLITLSACQPSSTSATPFATEAATVEVTAEVTGEVAVSPEWIEEHAGGIEIGMWKPVGWTVDSSTVVTVLEHDPTINGDRVSPESGIVINIFSPNLAHMDLDEVPEDTNQALWLLEYVVSTPGIISSSSVASTPQAFTWNGHDAAYYLLTGPHYKRGIVICVVVAPDRMVGINIAMPQFRADDTRRLIPQLFNDFTAAGVRLGSDDLAMLPDPLIFPERAAEQTPEQYGG